MLKIGAATTKISLNVDGFHKPLRRTCKREPNRIHSPRKYYQIPSRGYDEMVTTFPQMLHVKTKIKKCIVRNYSQGQCCNKVCIGEAQPSIALGEVPLLCVKGDISTKSNNICSHHTWEVDYRVCCQPNAWAYPRIIMQVLKFQLSSTSNHNKNFTTLYKLDAPSNGFYYRTEFLR